MNKIRGIVTKSWVILSLISPAVVGVSQVSAEDQDLGEEVLLKDNTFILGRVKVSQGDQLDVKANITEKGFKSIVTEEEHEVVSPDFEGYLEVTNRYKVGEDIWLEVEKEGKPLGYIKQGRLEVKPVTRVDKVNLPEDIDLEGEFEEDGEILSDLRFNGGESIQVSEGEKYKIIDLNQVSFYTKDVESFKVETQNSVYGWVKGSDIVEDKEDIRQKIEDREDKEKTDEEDRVKLKVELKKGTVLYDRPTYLEGVKSLDNVNKTQEVSVEDFSQNEGVREYYYKVYTKEGIGFLKVNPESQEINKEIREKIEVDSEEDVIVHVKNTEILTTKPKGVEGVSDQVLVETEDELKVKEEVSVGNIWAGIEELDEEELDEEELDEEELDEEELEEYYLVETEEGLEGYVLKEEVVFDTDKESYLEDKEKTLKEREEDKVRKKIEEKEALVRSSVEEKELEIENRLGVSIKELEGRSIGRTSSPSQVSGGVSRGARTVVRSGNTVDFINQLAPYSDHVKDKGLYPSVMMAQAILESGGGSSGLARNSNNLFGIKGSYQGQSTVYQTREYGGEVVINAGFRVYPTIEHSIKDYARLLNNNNYRRNGVVNASSPYASIVGLKRAGYATDPNYVSKVWNTIERYDLTRFD